MALPLPVRRETLPTSERAAAAPQPALADAPPLEPARSLQQQAAMQQQVAALDRGIQARINRLGQRNLAAADRKTLQDARTFVAQSKDAMAKGDFVQSSNLADKAELLVQAVEKRY